MNKSVYEIQNPVDFKPYTHEYLIQALANMGQRIGIRGDGIEYKSFRFIDLIEDYSYTSDEYIGVIRYINDECNFGIVKKEFIGNGNYVKYLVKDPFIFNKIKFPYEVSFDVPINNIEKYKNGSIISNDGKYFTTILLGKYFGNDDNDRNNSEIIYAKFNLIDNTLEKCIRIFYLCSSDIHNYYVLSKVEHTTENEYLQTVQVFDSSLLGDFQIPFESLFSYNDDTEYFSLFSKDRDYISFDAIENDEITEIDNDSNILTEISVVDVILKHVENKEYYPPKKFKLKYNTETSQYEALSNVSYKNEMAWLNEYGYDVNEQVNMLNNIISTLFYNLFLYFNKIYYISNKSTLIKRIICKLYESLCGENYQGSYMYVPLDYEFHYICNSNDDLDIYYSSNIYVTMCNVSQYDIDGLLESTKNIIFSYDGIDKVKACNFEISYNSKYDSLINLINVKDLYTLPYINSNNNWSVNDNDSGISAMGKDAGNPNIIFAYSNVSLNNDSMFTVLNNAANKSKILNCTWKERSFKVNTAYFNNPQSSSISCKCFIPVTTSNNIKYFKNALIVMLSSKSCIDEGEQDRYKYEYVTSIWSLSNDDGKDVAEFVCITDPENSEYALPFGTGIDTTSSYSNSSIGNLNNTDILLLKAIISTIGQDNLSINANNWITIRNKNAEEYNLEIDPESNDENQYENDLNLSLQFNDSIEIIGDHIVNSQKSSKYLANFLEEKPTTSNYLYKRFNNVLHEGVGTTTETIEKLIYVNSSYLVSNMTIDGKTVVNNDLVVLKSVPTYILEDEEVSYTYYSYTIEEDAGNYDEYVFNSNIPSIDMREVFIRNENVLNRVNIVTLDEVGNLYNSYIGSSYDDREKNIFRIGTTNTNINIGTNSLIDETDRSSFIKQDTLSIDFDNIVLNSSMTVSSNVWTKQIVGDESYYTTSIRPIGKLATKADSILSYTGAYMMENDIAKGIFSPNDDLWNENGFNESYLYLNDDTLGHQFDFNQDVIFRRILSYDSIEGDGEQDDDIPEQTDQEIISSFIDGKDISVECKYIRESIVDGNIVRNVETFVKQCPDAEHISILNIDVGSTVNILSNDFKVKEDIDGIVNEVPLNAIEQMSFNDSNYEYEIVDDGQPKNIIKVKGTNIKAMSKGKAMFVVYNTSLVIDTSSDMHNDPEMYCYFILVNVSEQHRSSAKYDAIFINNLMKYRLGIDISSYQVKFNDTIGSNKNLCIKSKRVNDKTEYYLILDSILGNGNDSDFEEVLYTNYEIKVMMYKENNGNILQALHIEFNIPGIDDTGSFKDSIIVSEEYNDAIFNNTSN